MLWIVGLIILNVIHSKNIPNTSDPISVPFPRRDRWDPDCAGRTGPCASRLVPGTQRERANARDGSGAFGAGGARAGRLMPCAGRLTEPRIARMCKAISL